MRDYKTERTNPLVEIVCPVCGKTFIPAPMHIYKVRKSGYYWRVCTWGCQMKWEKEHPRKLRS